MENTNDFPFLLNEGFVRIFSVFLNHQHLIDQTTSMKRSHFIALGIGTTVAWACEGVAAPTHGSTAFSKWLVKYGGHPCNPGQAGAVHNLRLRTHETATALHELANICDDHLLCDGNQIEGVFGGQHMCVKLAAA